MPSSPLQEFIGSLDPVDVATLFGGLRTAVPAGMAAYSGELNAGEAEWIARRRAERDAAAMREMEILQRLLPQAMARRQGQVVGPAPDVFIPTRPRVMRESPFIASQPRSTPVPQQYAKGGKVATKTLDEMQAELMSKEGLSRRSLFGLKPQYPVAKVNEPLSKVEQEVKRIEQQAGKSGLAPKVSTARVEVDPGTGSRKSVMESIAETPLSRRQVLKTAASQAAQSVLPVGDLMKLAGAPAVTSPVGAIAQAAVKSAPPVDTMIPALILKELSKFGDDYYNADFQDIVAAVAKEAKIPESKVDDVANGMSDILGISGWSGLADKHSGFQPHWIRPSDVAKLALGIDPVQNTSPLVLKSTLREMKKASPTLYSDVMRGIRDYTMSTNDSWWGAYDIPKEMGQILEKQFMRGEKSYKDVEDFFKKYY